MNFLIVLPAAIITAIILIVVTSGYEGSMTETYSYELIKVILYVVVLAGALYGVNVFVLLGGGILFAGGVGLISGSLTISTLIQSVSNGMAGMLELSVLVLIVGGVVELMKHNGGIDFLLSFITSKINSKKGAEFGIAALVSVVDLCTANNTISIVSAGPIAKDIADQYDIDPRKTASILDTFSACWQGIIPYGAQLITAAGIVGVPAVEIIKYLHYPALMLVCAIGSIIFGIPTLKKSDKKISQLSK
jgi:Na+/H+ antiporter NhaC